ncbi:hypothetical protein, partial [Caballeronia choica]|uniref:hypothetical protein n=1 Tax=Caballeronia choica TaxID=326476 RepID=UPI000A5A4756
RYLRIKAIPTLLCPSGAVAILSPQLKRSIRLVAVGRTELGTEDARYLRYLRDKFKLPFEYRQVKSPLNGSSLAGADT